MPLSDYQSFYVYTHQDPRTGEVVYVGMGQKDRAWSVRVSGQRSKDHNQWMETLIELGYTPGDWVKIQVKRLDKEQAILVETGLIDSLKPVFNKAKNSVYLLSKRDNNEVGFMKALREMGYSYTHIAFLCGADGQQSRKNTKAMGVWRKVNDITG
jgi:hypothetical protein